MKTSRVAELKVKLIINKKLYEKNIIDYTTFQKVNDLILYKLSLCK